jgi:RNA polymerase sigma-70 factor (ECF subfamily)
MVSARHPAGFFSFFLGKSRIRSSILVRDEKTMNQDIINWLTIHLLPFEAEFRLKLRRVCHRAADVDDVIQEVYCKVMQMEDVTHVQDPRGYFVQIAKNLITDRLRRDAVVNIEIMANLSELDVPDDTPGPERIVFGRAELRWVMGLIGSLPDRCREVFRARRIYGLSQKEAADSLGITEKAVEYESARGMELISEMMKRRGAHEIPAGAKSRKINKAGKTHVSDR